jgi:hypothetical protein
MQSEKAEVWTFRIQCLDIIGLRIWKLILGSPVILKMPVTAKSITAQESIRLFDTQQ